MLFDVWGSNAGIHWLGWAMVFIGLIVLCLLYTSPSPRD